MGYREGRSFEYRIIKELKDLGLKVKRSYLSRKPDLIVISDKIYLFEVKKRLKGKKVLARVYDLKEYFEQERGNKGELREVPLEDLWITITKEKRKTIVIEPLELDYSYLNNFLEQVELFREMKGKKVEGVMGLWINF